MWRHTYMSYVKSFLPLVEIQPQSCECENARCSPGALQLSLSFLLSAQSPEANILYKWQKHRAPECTVHVLPSGPGQPQMVAGNWKRGTVESVDAEGLQDPWGLLCIHLHTRIVMYREHWQLSCCVVEIGMVWCNKSFFRRFMVHGMGRCAAITCSSSKGFAQSVVYDIHSTLRTQVLFSSPKTRETCMWYTASSSDRHHVGCYS